MTKQWFAGVSFKYITELIRRQPSLLSTAHLIQSLVQRNKVGYNSFLNW